MALKMTVDSLAGLPADVSALYKAGAEGKFSLDLEGVEDTGALKRAKDHEKAARVNAEKMAADLALRLENLESEREKMLLGSIPKGDVEKLEGTWKKKFEAAATETDGLKGSLKSLLVDNIAQAIASKISTAPSLLMPHIRGRLTADYTSGKASTRVLDKLGQPSDMTLEELEKEIIANAEYAPIISASQATGSASRPTTRSAGTKDGGSLNWVTDDAKIIAAHITALKGGR